jgi:hypothetical protein
VREILKVLLGITVLAAALIVSAIFALRESNLNFWGEVGKALLTVAGTLIAALLITGALTQEINRRQNEQTEKEKALELEREAKEKALELERAARATKREYWRDVLHDLLSVNDAVQTSRLLIDAHRTARTYGEQMRQLITSRASLRRLELDPDVINDENGLAAALEDMRRYLDGLGQEYRASYLKASRIQRLDEAVLEREIIELAKSSAHAEPPIQPSRAWKFLEHECPLLMQFLDEPAYESEFRSGYKFARERIQGHLDHLNE